MAAGYEARTYVWEHVFVFYKNMNKTCVPVSCFFCVFSIYTGTPAFSLFSTRGNLVWFFSQNNRSCRRIGISGCGSPLGWLFGFTLHHCHEYVLQWLCVCCQTHKAARSWLELFEANNDIKFYFEWIKKFTSDLVVLSFYHDKSMIHRRLSSLKQHR